MQYCKRCVSPTTRPKLELNEQGICHACISAEEKMTQIDWALREAQLKQIFDKFRNQDGSDYDCIIPVSGGKDSTYQVHMVKNVFKMNPLCFTFRTLARTRRGEENLQALRNMGVDHIDFSPNPVVINKLTRKMFEEYGDCSIIDHLAIWGTTANFALRLGIPLVIWGENPDMEYGAPDTDRQNPVLNKEFLNKQDILKGKSIEDWISQNISIQELRSLVHPPAEALRNMGYTPIFLGYFIPWDAKRNVEIACQYGFKVREQGPVMGLYDYADLDCMNIVIHHYFKWLKFGFNRVTDHASNEIRKGRMTREEGIKLVREMDGIKPPKEYIEAFCKQIDISFEHFWEIAERFRNKDIWKQDDNGQWYLEGWIGGDRVPDRFPYLTL